MINSWRQWINNLHKNKNTPLLITLFFGIMICITVWNFMSNFHTTKLPTQQSTIKPLPPVPNIANLHLMGIYDTKTATLPTTQLQLTLQGTVVNTSDSTQSRALIASPDQPTKVYQIGDVVPGDAKIEKIDMHFVILDNNGQLQKLRLPSQVLPNIELPKN